MKSATGMKRLVLREGFTLVELLSVLAIVGILAALLLPTLGYIRKQAGIAQDLSNLRNLQAAWLCAAQENDGIAPVGSTGSSGIKSSRHWPGKLAPSLAVHFPDNEYSVYLDSDGVPVKTPFRNSMLPPPTSGERKLVSYGINVEGVGTWYSAGFVGAQHPDGTRLDRPARVMELGSIMILFGTISENWHLGNPVKAGACGQSLSQGPFNGVTVSAPWGRAVFVRVDGSAFTTDTIPPKEEWVLPY